MVSGEFHRLHIEIIKGLNDIKSEVDDLKSAIDKLYDLAEEEE